MTRFLYFYQMCDKPEVVHALVPAHVDYWQSHYLPDYSSGPFVHRTGMLTFAAASLYDAQHAVRQDPLVRAGVLEQSWVKEFWSSGYPQ